MAFDCWYGAAQPVGLVPPVVRDTSDGWLDSATPSGGFAKAALYPALDETAASDSDYIQSATNPSSDVAVIQLGSLTDPNVDTGHILRYRIYRG